MPKMICEPQSTRSSGDNALTVACVPTGMKAGVSMVPWGVVTTPNLAEEWLCCFRILNLNTALTRLGLRLMGIFFFHGVSIGHVDGQLVERNHPSIFIA